MNTLVKKVMGLSEDDCVPVPGGVLSARTYRSRARKHDNDTAEKGDEDAAHEVDEHRRNIRAILGESEPESEEDKPLFPKDAQDVDGKSHVLTARLKPIKDVIVEPSGPTGEKEMYLTPTAALTAPDATPEGMTPIDASKIPGGSGQPEQFSWTDLLRANSKPEESPKAPGEDTAVKAMDTLLGRDRRAPIKTEAEFKAENSIQTDEAALAAMGIQNPLIEAVAAEKAAAAMVANTGEESTMPAHKHSDAKTLCSVARKWL